MSYDYLPPVDNSITSNVDGSFADADQRLRGACKNRKARKRIRQEDIQAVQDGRVNSVSATQSGLQSQQKASGDSSGLQDTLSLASRLLGLSSDDQAAATPDIIRIAQSFLLPPIPASSPGDVQRSTDVAGLTETLTKSEKEGLDLNKGLQSVGQQQASQMLQNTTIGKQIQKFSSLEQEYASKEAAIMKKVEQFQNLATKFDQVATSLVTAATAITSASASIDAAAAACAAIPFVGPAIAAALKVAGSALRVVARALQMVGKQMQTLSKTMKASSIAQKASAGIAKAQKIQAQVKKVANQASQKLGLKRLQDLVGQRKQLQDAVSRNQNDRQQVRNRLQELQGKGALPAQSVKKDTVTPAQAELQLQQHCMEIGALRFTSQSPERLIQKQQALCMLYDQFATQKVMVSAAVEAKVRKALAGSPFQPQLQIQTSPDGKR